MSVAAPERPTVPLTPEQRRAVSLRDRDVFCEAGAGSGKTRVLVERYCAAVADDGVLIDRVLAFTFTERAATELRSRIRGTLLRRGRAALAAGDRDRGYELIDLARASERGWVMTIHGFCRRLLAARPAVVGLDPRFRVLDEAEAGRLRDRAIAEALADLAARDRAAARALAAYRPRRFADMVTAAYTRLRSQGMVEPRLPEIGDPRASRPDGSDAADELTPAELTAARDAAGTLEGALERFARRYDELKAARGGLDFADLELRAVAMLEDETAGAGWRGRFDHILVDEFQDTNSVQVRLVETLRGPSTRLFAVGDENQSIYRFRNAELEVFRAERARAEADPATEILPLRGNFRSVPGVLGAVNAIGEALLDRFVPLEAGRSASAGAPGAELLLTLEDGPDATWAELEDALEPPRSETNMAVVAEARTLAGRLGELVFGGAADRGDIVVLLRAFTHVDAYEEALERAGLRPYVVGGRGYWSQQQVEDVVRLLAAIANPLDDELLLGALASPACGASPDSLWLLRRSAGEGRHLWPALVRALGGAEAPEPDGDGVDPVPLAAIPDSDAERLRRFCATLAPLRAAAPVVPLEELVERTIVAFGYDLAFLAKPQALGRMANVRKLGRLAREFEQHEGRDLAGFLAAATASARRDEREGMAALAAEEHDGVRVMTVHAAKGLEFPVVAVPDLGRSLDAGHRWGDVVIAPPGGDRRFGMRLAFPAARSRGLWELDALGRAERDAEVAESCRLVHVAATRATERLILSGCFKAAMVEPAEPRPSDSAIRRLLPVLAARGWDGADDEVDLPAPAPVAGSAANGAGASSVALAIRVNRPSAERAATLAARAPRSDAAATEAIGGPPPLIEGRPRQIPVGHLSYSALSTYESCGYRFYAERVLGLGSPPTAGAASAGLRDAGESADPAEELAREADELVEPGRDRAEALAFGAAVHAGLEWSARHGWTEPPRDLLASLVTGDASAAERAAALIAGWLGSPLGDEVRASRARPEVPFALPLADTVVRGKIDLLLDGGGQRRTVIDFKTDRLAGRSAAELGRRYAIQRLLYALAAAKPEAAATVRAIHVFLEEPGEPVVEELGPLELAAGRERVGALIARIRAAEFAPAHEPEPALCFGCPAAANLCPNAAWRPPRR